MVWNEIFVNTNDGAELFTRYSGEGSPLLLIHGAIVDSEFFSDFGEILAKHFFTIIYDRRGYGRSTLGMLEPESMSDPDSTMNEVEYYRLQGDDAAKVVETVDGLTGCGTKVAVLGCSAGAVVAAYFATYHKNMAGKLFLHEPPMYSYVKEDKETWGIIDDISSSIYEKKYNRAINKFLFFHGSHSGPSKKPMTEIEIDHFQKNAMTFVKKEYRKAFGENLSIDGIKGMDVALLYGTEEMERPLITIADRTSRSLKCEKYPMPGAHNGARDDAKEFAEAFLKILKCE